MNSIHSRNCIFTIQVYTLNVINTDYVDKEQIPGTHSKKDSLFHKTTSTSYQNLLHKSR